jgi:hypothetical protein
MYGTASKGDNVSLVILEKIGIISFVCVYETLGSKKYKFPSLLADATKAQGICCLRLMTRAVNANNSDRF